MNCPNCQSDNNSVLETRTVGNGKKIKRRRKCLDCNYKFTTYEIIEEVPLLIIKKDGRLEKFDVVKLTESLALALKNRPIADDTIENIVNEIVSAITFNNENKIFSTIICEYAMEYLRNIDTLAFIRYTSQHLDFNDATDYMQFIQQFL